MSTQQNTQRTPDYIIQSAIAYDIMMRSPLKTVYINPIIKTPKYGVVISKLAYDATKEQVKTLQDNGLADFTIVDHEQDVDPGVFKTFDDTHINTMIVLKDDTAGQLAEACREMGMDTEPLYRFKKFADNLYNNSGKSPKMAMAIT